MGGEVPEQYNGHRKSVEGSTVTTKAPAGLDLVDSAYLGEDPWPRQQQQQQQQQQVGQWQQQQQQEPVLHETREEAASPQRHLSNQQQQQH
jgi:hypothetical protein